MINNKLIGITSENPDGAKRTRTAVKTRQVPFFIFDY